VASAPIAYALTADASPGVRVGRHETRQPWPRSHPLRSPLARKSSNSC